MTETESIAVAEVSDGPCGTGRVGQPVELPVVELLTGRGFITGKSGSGKSNSASVIAEKLLDNGFGMLIVDIDGEYYGLKEEYEILHAGADDECDIQVDVDHAEKLASLALEQNVPIILDVSSFLDESEAEALLTEVSKQLFAKAKKLKQPFLMLVEEVHEYIPEKGSVGECGKMLIKVAKRGRKHGLGMVGISQRPADVKKDFITQCDWLVWHRLTWNNDTKVVKRIVGTDHGNAVEDLDDGEAFLKTDWADRIRRVQFYRKQTFDAGATPGLEDFERPDLKSVSDDLVSELESISEEQQETEDRIADLREELDRKNSRIAELEAELQDARDMQRMAEQFTQALVEHVEGVNPGRTEVERMRDRHARPNGEPGPKEATADDPASGDPTADDPASGDPTADDPASGGPTAGDPPTDEAVWSGGPPDEDYDAAAMTWPGESDDAASDGEGQEADPQAPWPGSEEAPTEDDSTASSTESGEADTFSAEGDEAFELPADSDDGTDTTDGVDASDPETITRGFADVSDNPLGDRATNAFAAGDHAGTLGDGGSDAGAVVRHLRSEIDDLDARTRQMLRYYRDHGPGTPMDALFAAGGADDRTEAYARNRRLRVRGLVEHVGRGRYDDRLASLLREHTGHQQVDSYVERVERTLGTDTDTDSSTASSSPDGQSSGAD